MPLPKRYGQTNSWCGRTVVGCQIKQWRDFEIVPRSLDGSLFRTIWLKSTPGFPRPQVGEALFRKRLEGRIRIVQNRAEIP